MSKQATRSRRQIAAGRVECQCEVKFGDGIDSRKDQKRAIKKFFERQRDEMVRAKSSKLAAEVNLSVPEFRQVSKKMKKTHYEAINADV